MYNDHIKERFWDLVDRSDNAGCWPWLGSRCSRTHYGRFSPFSGTSISAHRASWQIVNGEIPVGLLVLHHCDNPPCVRPEHLFIGTHRENSHDMISKGRAVWQRTPAPESQLIEIKQTSPEDIAIRNELAQQAIQFIARKLNNRDRLIFFWRFGLNGDIPMTFEEIGERLGISRAATEQRLAIGIARVQKQFRLSERFHLRVGQ